MTTIYSVSGFGSISYHATLAEARRDAVSQRTARGFEVELQKHRIDHQAFAKRELYCRLLNSEGWAHSTEDLA